MKYGVIVETISAAALAAGLPEGRVIDRTVGDNITLKRPRLELQVLKERFTRTGRKLGIRRESGEKVRKQATQQAGEAAWLEERYFTTLARMIHGDKTRSGR